MVVESFNSESFPLKITITKSEKILIAQATGQSAFNLEAIEKNKFDDRMTEVRSEFGEENFLKAVEKVKEYIEIAKTENGNILWGGNEVTVNGHENGYYLQPTVIEVPTDDSPSMAMGIENYINK